MHGDRGGAGMQGQLRIASVAAVAIAGLLLTAGCTSTPASPSQAEAAIDTSDSTPTPQAAIAERAIAVDTRADFGTFSLCANIAR